MTCASELLDYILSRRPPPRLISVHLAVIFGMITNQRIGEDGALSLFISETDDMFLPVESMRMGAAATGPLLCSPYGKVQ